MRGAIMCLNFQDRVENLFCGYSLMSHCGLPSATRSLPAIHTSESGASYQREARSIFTKE